MVIVQCCVCRKVRLKGWWTKFPQWVVKKFFRNKTSHTYCPKCLEVTQREIEELHRTRKVPTT